MFSTASVTGGVQIAARVVETALHKLHEVGCDVRRVVAVTVFALSAYVTAEAASSLWRHTPPGDSLVGLARAARDERYDGAPVVRVERARAKRFAYLLRELPIGTQRRIEFAVDFADHAISRGF